MKIEHCDVCGKRLDESTNGTRAGNCSPEYWLNNIDTIPYPPRNVMFRMVYNGADCLGVGHGKEPELCIKCFKKWLLKLVDAQTTKMKTATF